MVLWHFVTSQCKAGHKIRISLQSASTRSKQGCKWNLLCSSTITRNKTLVGSWRNSGYSCCSLNRRLWFKVRSLLQKTQTRHLVSPRRASTLEEAKRFCVRGRRKILVSNMEALGVRSSSVGVHPYLRLFKRTKPECHLFGISFWLPKMTAKGTKRIVKLG